MSKQLLTLLWTYRLGIPLGMLIAVVVPSQIYLLIFSWSHMVLLWVLGVRVQTPHHITAGKKIELAGYLYTLIGVAAALFVFADSSVASRAWMIPTGTALGTSILGYFAGGEIAAKGTVTPEKSIRFEGEKIAGRAGGLRSCLAVGAGAVH